GKWRMPVGASLRRTKSPSWASAGGIGLGQIRLAAAPFRFASNRATAEHTALATGAPANDDPVEPRQLILQPAPDPAADDLQRRYLQPLDVVEVGVVEHHPQLGDLLVYFAEIV